MKAYLKSELIRYIINGVCAAIIHFSVLYICIEIVLVKLASVANIFAALFGISASFLGSRYFVFKNTSDNIKTQVLQFLCLYVFTAMVHGLIMYYWADIYQLDYRQGFIVAVMFQVVISYFGNKYLIFNEKKS